jgi:O-antigen/teichoic acid export membrane protein
MISPLLRLGKDSLLLLAARLAAQGLAVLFTVMVARWLGSRGFGEYAFFTALILAGNVLTTFGTDMLLIRAVASRQDFSGLPAALLIQLVLSGFFIAALWTGAGRIPNQSPEAVRALQIFSLALIPLAFFSIFTTALRGRQLMGWYALLNMAAPALQVGAVIWMGPGGGLIRLSLYLVLIQALAALLTGFICTIAIAGFWKAWRFSLPDLLRVLRAAAPIATLGLLGMLYQKLGILMLSTMSGPAETGIFSAAARAVEASKAAHLAAFTALYPAMSRAQTDLSNGSQWARMFRTSGKGLLAGALLAALILSAFAAPLVDLLFGVEFTASAPILRILAWTLLPFTANSFLSLGLMASGRERIVAGGLAASLVGLALMSFWWIPLDGAEGAAWAILAAECIQLAALLWHREAAQVLVEGGVRGFPHLP